MNLAEKVIELCREQCLKSLSLPERNLFLKRAVAESLAHHVHSLGPLTQKKARSLLQRSYSQAALYAAKDHNQFLREQENLHSARIKDMTLAYLAQRYPGREHQVKLIDDEGTKIPHTSIIYYQDLPQLEEYLAGKLRPLNRQGDVWALNPD